MPIAPAMPARCWKSQFRASSYACSIAPALLALHSSSAKLNPSHRTRIQVEKDVFALDRLKGASNIFTIEADIADDSQIRLWQSLTLPEHRLAAA
jgi:hypothetical protein